MSAALRIATRELRGGLAGFRIFLACLALGVAAIAAVASVREAIQAGLTQEASALLGGDAEARFTYRFASAEERAWLDANAAAVSEVVDFRSMLVAGEERGLTQVKGVDDLYPLYGTMALEPDIPLQRALAGQDGLPGLVAEPVLADRMGLDLGDMVRLGTQDFVLMARLLREPDSITSGFSPRPPQPGFDRCAPDKRAPEPRHAVRQRLSPSPRPGGAGGASCAAPPSGSSADSGLRWRDNRNGTPGSPASSTA